MKRVRAMSAVRNTIIHTGFGVWFRVSGWLLRLISNLVLAFVSVSRGGKRNIYLSNILEVCRGDREILIQESQGPDP